MIKRDFDTIYLQLASSSLYRVEAELNSDFVHIEGRNLADGSLAFECREKLDRKSYGFSRQGLSSSGGKLAQLGYSLRVCKFNPQYFNVTITALLS